MLHVACNNLFLSAANSWPLTGLLRMQQPLFLLQISRRQVQQFPDGLQLALVFADFLLEGGISLAVLCSLGQLVQFG